MNEISKTKEIDQVIIKGSVARKLIKMGFNVIDIRPQKQLDGTIDFSRNVIVFGAKEGLQEAVNILLKKNK
jgi:hypothetical protein